jgi:hypothetical protein
MLAFRPGLRAHSFPRPPLVYRRSMHSIPDKVRSKMRALKLGALTSQFRSILENELRSRFDCKRSKDLPTELLGLHLRKTRRGFCASIADYLDRLEYSSETPTYSEYASIRAMLLWICQVRPDTSAFVAIVSSITAETYIVNEDV